MIYLNQAATSWPKAPGVREAMAAALEGAPAGHRRLLEEARAGIAAFLGVADPDRLLLTPACTSALAVAIGDLPWERGDVVVTSSVEHHAVARPVEKLVRERGVVHRAAPYRPGEPIDLDFVREALAGGGVRLVAVTAASNVTGEVLPVEVVARLAREHGALSLVDAAQTVGLLPVDAARLGADLLTFAGHKGPLGPQGIGGLWAAPGVVFQSPGAACQIDTGGPRACSPFPGYCDVGSANLAGAAGLAAGMGWLRRQGTEATGGRARALAARLVEGLRDRAGVTLHGAADAERTATVSLSLDALPLDRAEGFFRSRGLVVRAGGHCAPMALEAIGFPGGTLRISFGPFSADGHVEAALDAVEAACGEH